MVLGLAEGAHLPPAAPAGEPIVSAGRPPVPVPLPKGTPPIVGITGRDDADVWLLAQGAKAAVALHWDGKRFEKHAGPDCGKNTRYELLGLVGEALVAAGPYADFDDGGSTIARRAGRAWSCEYATRGQALPVSGALLRYAHGWEISLAGERQPFPWDGAPSLGAGSPRDSVGRLAASAPHDVWLWGGAHVLHGDGVRWQSRPPGVAVVHAVAPDGTGAAWLAGGNDAKKGGDVVLCWDPAARAWSRPSLPSDLRVFDVLAGARGDVWLLGGGQVHHVEGRAFRRHPDPLPDRSAAWVAPSGALWLAGAQSGQGAVFHVPVERSP